MTSILFFPRLLMAVVAGAALALLGALVHQRTMSVPGFGIGQDGWRGLGIPYGSAFAALVLVLWLRRMRNVWGAAAAAVLAISWACTSLLLASSSTDILIATNAIGVVHLLLCAVCALLAAGWPPRTQRAPSGQFF